MSLPFPFASCLTQNFMPFIEKNLTFVEMFGMLSIALGDF